IMPTYLQLVVHPPVTVTLKFQLPTKRSVVWASVKPGSSPITPIMTHTRAILASLAAACCLLDGKDHNGCIRQERDSSESLCCGAFELKTQSLTVVPRSVKYQHL